MKILTLKVGFSLMIFSVLTGCGAPPVPVSECDNVVKHIKSILKDKAPPSSEMSKQCKAATDDQRGCVMAADKPMKVLNCM